MMNMVVESNKTITPYSGGAAAAPLDDMRLSVIDYVS